MMSSICWYEQIITQQQEFKSVPSSVLSGLLSNTTPIATARHISRLAGAESYGRLTLSFNM